LKASIGYPDICE